MTVMFVLVFVVLGIVSFRNLIIERFPQIDFPVVSITAVYGGASPEDFNTSVTTTNTTENLVALNTIQFDDFKNARVAVGWTLPYDRGALEVVFDGYGEDGFTFVGEGQTNQVRVAGSDSNRTLTEPITWWRSTLANGQYVARLLPPVWTDGNNNNIVDEGEIEFPGSPVATSSRRSASPRVDAPPFGVIITRFYRHRIP